MVPTFLGFREAPCAQKPPRAHSCIGLWIQKLDDFSLSASLFLVDSQGGVGRCISYSLNS